MTLRGHISNGNMETRYAELLQEWLTGEQHDACQSRNWQEAYTKLHREVRKIFTQLDARRS